jgi:UDP-N-acetylmuramate dehydrogenase
MSSDDCGFDYRTSVFKKTDRFVVARVRFVLSPASTGVVRYAELARALGCGEGARAPLGAIRSTVLSLRRGKGMVVEASDPDSVSAGSFFVNPVVATADFERLIARVAEAGVLRAGETMPRFAAGEGRWKASAGWLIERAGFVKGFGDGRVGVSTKHALALVNRGGATTNELLALARTIRDGVYARFGVTLTAEPVMIGCAL